MQLDKRFSELVPRRQEAVDGAAHPHYTTANAFTNPLLVDGRYPWHKSPGDSTRPSTDIQSSSGNQHSTTNSHYSLGSTNDNSSGTDSLPLSPTDFSMSPNGDVVVEIDGLPRRLPVDGQAILQSGKKGQASVPAKGTKRTWLRR